MVQIMIKNKLFAFRWVVFRKFKKISFFTKGVLYYIGSDTKKDSTKLKRLNFGTQLQNGLKIYIPDLFFLARQDNINMK